MKRRDFLAIFGAAAVWPVAARAQQPGLPVIGHIDAGSAWETAHLAAAFLQGLRATGYVEGKNVIIEQRWAEGHYERLPVFVNEFVSRPVSVIAATGGSISALTAKAATSTIPIVFQLGADPVHVLLSGPGQCRDQQLVRTVLRSDPGRIVEVGAGHGGAVLR